MARSLLLALILLAASSASAGTVTLSSSFSIVPMLPTRAGNRVVVDLGKTVAFSGYGGWTAIEQSPLVMVSTLTNIVTDTNPTPFSDATMRLDGSVKLENLANKQQYFRLMFFTTPAITAFSNAPGPGSPSFGYSVPFFGTTAFFSVDYDDPATLDYSTFSSGLFQVGRYSPQTLVALPGLSSATVEYQINVSAYLASRVPEPMLWQTLIMGFGFVGAFMRRRGYAGDKLSRT